ncbi:putative bifunctional diguanylate cyclase/phosphodiesterase [Rhizobium terricola]|uniref:putative bifunctional diguanylate cyclase/phosphodiesterase n=1 Tax=Rhizobium terricola TaxID=2728849 RepID=UPI001FEEB3C2|nr:EAL domain-containing protein [Rhizobium terricola]
MKHSIRWILEALKVPNENPELTLSQFEAFSKQVPLLYFILTTNMLSLAWTHRDIAPAYLVIYLPAVLSIIFVARGIGWFVSRNRKVDAAQAYHRLKATNRLAAPIAIFCTGWSVALLPYGDGFQQAHVAFFMAITVIGCIFCLMHLRSAAMVVTVLVNAPFFLAMVLSGEETFVATGINVILVSMAMIAVLLTHYRDFHQLAEQRLVLQAQNKTMKALSDENLRLANLDSLTLIANRRSFFHTLDQAFARAQSEGGMLAIGVIDLDGFKPINDMYGHSAGDKVLVEVAERLSRFADGAVSVFRLGGDEFALIVTGNHDEASVVALGNRVCDAIAQRINLGGGVVQVTASLGFATFPQVGANGQELYERADYALYTAKKHHRAGVVVFNAEQADELSRQKVVEETLQVADLETELSLVFQPIIDVASRRPAGFEALARWNCPTIGPVSPAEFIPIAEYNGRIGLITRLLLERALKTAATWPDDVFLSFNLSPHDLATAEGVNRLVGIIRASGVDPRRITFEITETAVMSDFEQANASIRILRQLGCGIALDDFGTGYASLSYVHRLPLSKIKVDGSFVREIHRKETSVKIVKSVLALCAEMRLEAIVEGVETENEMAILETLGVGSVQGYHFARPMAEAETHAFLKGTGASLENRRVS